MMRKCNVEFYHIGWSITIEIDEGFSNENGNISGHIKSMVEFWYGWEDELKDCQGSYTATFLKKLARQCFYLLCQHDWTTDGLIDELKKIEGWCPIDGSYGIKILSVDTVELTMNDFDIQTVK